MSEICHRNTWKEPQKNTNLLYFKIFMRATFKTRLATIKKTGDSDLPKIINQIKKINMKNDTNSTKYNSVTKNNLFILKSAPKAGNKTGSTRFYYRTANKNEVETEISINRKRKERKARKQKDERPNYCLLYTSPSPRD